MRAPSLGQKRERQADLATSRRVTLGQPLTWAFGWAVRDSNPDPCASCNPDIVRLVRSGRSVSVRPERVVASGPAQVLDGPRRDDA